MIVTPGIRPGESTTPAALHGLVTFAVSATDNVGVASLGLTIDGNPVGLDAAGRVTLRAEPAGLYAVVASATDAAGNTGLASTTLTVVDPSDADAPEVDITAPATDAVITGRKPTFAWYWSGGRPSLVYPFHGDPERTAEVLDADGWLHTGDRGTVDAEGRVAFLGRIKELIRVGGENVGPAEIEGLVSTHPAVHLVQAVGVPDERLDEVPAVFVQLKPGAKASEEELIAWCRGRIASFKVPRYVRFVDEWPMSATKIQRFRLRERLVTELEA